MTHHKTGTREEWLAARLDLLTAEKELTRRSDELAEMRQQLPWVKVEKEYRFETERGAVSLAGLFQGRSQLLVYHFMFGPDFKAGFGDEAPVSVADILEMHVRETYLAVDTVVYRGGRQGALLLIGVE